MPGSITGAVAAGLKGHSSALWLTDTQDILQHLFEEVASIHYRQPSEPANLVVIDDGKTKVTASLQIRLVLRESRHSSLKERLDYSFHGTDAKFADSGILAGFSD